MGQLLVEVDHFLGAIQNHVSLLVTLPAATKEEGPTSALTIFYVSFTCNMLSPSVMLVYHNVTVVILYVDRNRPLTGETHYLIDLHCCCIVGWKSSEEK